MTTIIDDFDPTKVAGGEKPKARKRGRPKKTEGPANPKSAYEGEDGVKRKTPKAHKAVKAAVPVDVVEGDLAGVKFTDAEMSDQAIEKALRAMYFHLIEQLKVRVLSGAGTASELALALKILSENGVSSVRKKGNAIDKLAESVASGAAPGALAFPFAHTAAPKSDKEDVG